MVLAGTAASSHVPTIAPKGREESAPLVRGARCVTEGAAFAKLPMAGSAVAEPVASEALAAAFFRRNGGSLPGASAG